MSEQPTVDVTFGDKTYNLPILVIERIRFFRGINAADCTSINPLEPYNTSFPFLWMTNDAQMAAKYGDCLYSFDLKRGEAIRLLDVWSQPVFELMREQFNMSEKEALSYYVGVNPGVKASKFVSRGRVPYVQEIKPMGSDTNVAERVFPGSSFVPSTSGTPEGALRWRGFRWGDEARELSRHSLDMFDEEVVRGLYSLIKQTGLDGMHIPMLPSHIHETVTLRHVFDEEFIIMTGSLASKFDPPQRLTVTRGGRHKTHKLIRRRRVRKTRHTRSNVTIPRARHIQRKI
jgi:hypothetical protein